MQLRRSGEADRPFRVPEWAYVFTDETIPPRSLHPEGNNFWWVSFGGVKDTLHDAEEIREELFKIAYGAWAYIKNHPDGRGKGWTLDWIGSLPGKQESWRFEGDHILTQCDIEAGGIFPDTVAHGGWNMDEHMPEAFYFKGKPSILHPTPSPFGIPYRSLYSRNIRNLLFAGRQISASHMAQSSIRVMGTCAVTGQAAGTAAALAVKYGTFPREVGSAHLAELRETLLEDDQFIPGLRRMRRLSRSSEPPPTRCSATGWTATGTTDLTESRLRREIPADTRSATPWRFPESASSSTATFRTTNVSPARRVGRRGRCRDACSAASGSKFRTGTAHGSRSGRRRKTVIAWSGCTGRRSRRGRSGFFPLKHGEETGDASFPWMFSESASI